MAINWNKLETKIYNYHIEQHTPPTFHPTFCIFCRLQITDMKPLKTQTCSNDL